MIPITFTHANFIYGANQEADGYLPLPCYRNDQETISCWQLTWRERLSVLFTGRLWLRQLNYRRPLQPQQIMVTSPFEP